jgi:hypothetical protein
LQRRNAKKSKLNKKSITESISGNSFMRLLYPCAIYVFAFLRKKANICVHALPVHVVTNLEYCLSSASHGSHSCRGTAAIPAHTVEVLTDQTFGP